MRLLASRRFRPATQQQLSHVNIPIDLCLRLPYIHLTCFLSQIKVCCSLVHELSVQSLLKVRTRDYLADNNGSKRMAIWE